MTMSVMLQHGRKVPWHAAFTLPRVLLDCEAQQRMSQLSKATHSLSTEYCTGAMPDDQRSVKVVLHPLLAA